MTSIIEIAAIGKKYNIAHQRGGYIALRDVITNIIKTPFAFLRTKARLVSGKDTHEEFWALKGVSASIAKGEIVGIIGRNGAGKSTLLKILSQITPPTTGEITIRGRVGSLLEVGTGFHPELSGRENIFLNGAILGMSRAEIAAKFDEIVKFAGIEKFLDTPVKYYSSGMYVRLAFSVAAHMEPDILIIDEVLAVGDAEFQKKCLGKMEEVTKKDGRTILFVSHNMSAVKQLCTRAIFMENGKIKMDGPTDKVVDEYLGFGSNAEERNRHATIELPPHAKSDFQIRKIQSMLSHGTPTIDIPIAENFKIAFEYEVRKEMESVFISLLIFKDGSQRIVDIMEIDALPSAVKTRLPGKYATTIEIPGFLNEGLYDTMIVIERGHETLDKQAGPPIKIIDNKARVYPINGRAPITPNAIWDTKHIA